MKKIDRIQDINNQFIEAYQKGAPVGQLVAEYFVAMDEANMSDRETFDEITKLVKVDNGKILLIATPNLTTTRR